MEPRRLAMGFFIAVDFVSSIAHLLFKGSKEVLKPFLKNVNLAMTSR